MPPVAKPTVPRPTIAKAAERRLARVLVKEHNVLVGKCNSRVELCISKHEEILERKEAIHREDIRILEGIISNLCQGAPQKAGKVREKVKAEGLRRAEVRSKRDKLESPEPLPTMEVDALDALVEPVPSPAPAKAPPLAKGRAFSWK